MTTGVVRHACRHRVTARGGGLWRLLRCRRGILSHARKRFSMASLSFLQKKAGNCKNATPRLQNAENRSFPLGHVADAAAPAFSRGKARTLAKIIALFRLMRNYFAIFLYPQKFQNFSENCFMREKCRSSEKDCRAALPVQSLRDSAAATPAGGPAWRRRFRNDDGLGVAAVCSEGGCRTDSSLTTGVVSMPPQSDGTMLLLFVLGFCGGRLAWTAAIAAVYFGAAARGGFCFGGFFCGWTGSRCGSMG